VSCSSLGSAKKQYAEADRRNLEENLRLMEQHRRATVTFAEMQAKFQERTQSQAAVFAEVCTK
jgi:hypothetical protein